MPLFILPRPFRDESRVINLGRVDKIMTLLQIILTFKLY